MDFNKQKCLEQWIKKLSTRSSLWGYDKVKSKELDSISYFVVWDIF
jgi:hypothetical protein